MVQSQVPDFDLQELIGVEGCLQRIKEGSSSSREIRKELVKLDFSSLLEESKTHSSTSAAAEIAEFTSWRKEQPSSNCIEPPSGYSSRQL